MTAPAVFTRHRTIVEAMPIRANADLIEAQRWLAKRGVNSILGLNEAGPDGIRPARGKLILFGPDDQRMTLTTGQWLVRDVSFGDFTVLDDPDFTALHAPHDADDLEALMRAVQ